MFKPSSHSLNSIFHFPFWVIIPEQEEKSVPSIGCTQNCQLAQTKSLKCQKTKFTIEKSRLNFALIKELQQHHILRSLAFMFFFSSATTYWRKIHNSHTWIIHPSKVYKQMVWEIFNIAQASLLFNFKAPPSFFQNPCAC